MPKMSETEATAFTVSTLQKLFWGCMMLLVLVSGGLAISGNGSALKAGRAARTVYRHAASMAQTNVAPWMLRSYQALITQNSSKNDALPIAASICAQAMPEGLPSSGPLHPKSQNTACAAIAVIKTDRARQPDMQRVVARLSTAPKAAKPTPGATNVANAILQQSAQTVARAERSPDLQSLKSRAYCAPGTSLNIVAHEDDDLLFLNPDVQADILAGRCVRTLYVTAGDAGGDAAYWQGRENGAKTAYAAMYNVPNSWSDKTELLDGRRATVSYLDTVPGVALTFLRLPDGNMRGEGFAATSSESLAKLISGELPGIHTVDGRSAYTEDEVVSTLLAVMQLDQPDYIRTQNPTGATDGDHADHAATGTLTTLAAAMYGSPHKLATYMGYPDVLLAANLSSDQIGAKQAIFLAYAQHDGAVCQSGDECAQNVSYGNFLTRQYKISEVASGQ